jgi:putative zinc finger/helix-turn-helix YgiT family protein
MAQTSKPFPWKCGHCRKQAVEPATVPYAADIEYEGRTYPVHLSLKIPRCSNCGEMVLDSAANKQITEAFRQQFGLLTGDQIRQNREALGFTQKQLSSQMGIAEATLSRWETSAQIQQKAMDRMLRLFFGLAIVRETLGSDERISKLGITECVSNSTVLEPTA